MGGLISPHKDSSNDEDQYESTTSEATRYGGTKYMTFMIYLTNVESGGHTIFPQLGVSV